MIVNSNPKHKAGFLGPRLYKQIIIGSKRSALDRLVTLDCRLSVKVHLAG